MTPQMIFKRLAATCAFTGMLAGASAAVAQQPGVAPQSGYLQERGFYVGGALGQAQARDFCDRITGVAFAGGCDDKDTAWKVFGGYQINRYFGVEVGYADFGEFPASGTVLGFPAAASAEATAFELLGIGTFPFTQRLSGYAKAGGFRWDVDTVAAVGAVARGGSDDGIDFTYGLGLKYDFTRNLAARFEFQRYNNVGETNTTGQSDVNMWSVGLMFKF